ncbi:MAG: ribosome biogenesis GTPase Der [Deltaproteobacteria bacterium]|nr:ribosome biogenesis GTPase Der [Deltaproteobacteria bacterium]
MGYIVAIVGAPNVGKSSLFSRLIRRRKAIVDDQPGVTRDRNYQEVTWEGRTFSLVDTGGFEWDRKGQMDKGLREQIEMALEEADLIVFVGDGKTGLTPADEQVIRRLRRTSKPVIYALNKIDNPQLEEGLADYFRLGLETILPVSALHGRGVEHLKEVILSRLPATEEETEAEKRIRLAVIGRPNVGKSSLVNSILGFERVLVSPEPGTTRDVIDTPFEYKDRRYLLIDTAGIRRKARVAQRLEKFSVLGAIKGIDQCDLAVILLDATQGVTDQDARIAGLAFEKGKGVIVAVNKWDLIEKDLKNKKQFLEDIRYHLKYLAFAPVLPLSAKTGLGREKLLNTIHEVYRQYTRRVDTGPLNQALKTILAGHSLPLRGGQRVKIYYAAQVEVKPPTFVFFANYPENIHFSYQRYLTNQLREHFRFTLCPIKIIFRKREKQA